jgi:hypothetical protein
MLTPPRTIHVKPGSELDRLLEDAAGTPIILEKSGVRYRLDRLEPSTESEVPPPAEVIKDSITNIVGVGSSEHETDIARCKQAYLADALDPAHHP